MVVGQSHHAYVEYAKDHKMIVVSVYPEFVSITTPSGHHIVVRNDGTIRKKKLNKLQVEYLKRIS